MALPELEQMNERLERIEGLLVANKTVLTMREAAILTGLSLSHLYKLTSTNGIPCYKPTGKAIYFNRLVLMGETSGNSFNLISLNVIRKLSALTPTDGMSGAHLLT